MEIKREGETLEFKESLSQKSRAFESLAAMLTKSGEGEVIFGIKDNGEICGVTLGKETIKDISRNITNRIKPLVIPFIEEQVIEGKTILSIKVKGNNKPYSFDNNYLIRSGSENKKIDVDLLKEIILSNSEELMINMESFNQDLTFKQLEQLYLLKNLYFNKETFKETLNLLTKDKKYNLLASLLSDNNDFSIKVVKFSSLDKSEMIERTEYGYRCLLLGMQAVLDYVKNLNITRVNLKDKAQREETNLFNYDSFREAWINACLHTKWQKLIPPAVYIFPNRIEIISNGGLAYDFSVESFYLGVSHTINLSLQKIFSQFDYVEQTGHGIPTIIRHYGKEAFLIDSNYILVTLKFSFPLSMNNRLEVLSKNQRTVYEAIKNNPSIKTDELMKITSLGSTTIGNIISYLKDNNYIVRNGSNKSGYWIILEDAK